ncbi:MAG TPA: Ig-like domain-containing protein [Longimicrobiaceae bacterium]|nr:Ig-like domain-containing protein [Longimicrobiaceae bacterium]
MSRALPALALLLLSCVADSPTPVGPEPEPDAVPVAVAATAGTAQTGVTGAALGSQLVVRVTDAKGRGVANVAVAWAVSPGGGTLASASGATDAGGEASAQWTLGTAAGTHTVTATVAELPPVTFSAEAAPPLPAKLEAAGGEAQTGDAGAPLADSLAVRVLAADGRPVPGVAVSWVVKGGDGALDAAATTTGDGGIAKARWTLGRAAGAQTVEAAVAGLSGSPVAFRATALAGSGAALSRVSGDGQSATAGTALPAPLVVRVADALGNPVAGASVTWMVASGGGSVSPAVSTTDTEGLARAAWTLGSTAGANSATATAAGATAGFSASGTAGPAAKLERVAGDGQSAAAGSALPAPLVVRVTDAHGNAVAGAAVGWAATSGGGSLAPAAPTTDAEGRTSASWTLGGAAGANAATASVAGVGTVSFTATASAPAGNSLSLAKAAGDGQAAAAQTFLPAKLVVRVVDASGNPVPGLQVTWSPGATSGWPSPNLSGTDPDGRASTTWIVGSAGVNTMTASVAGASPVTFTATVSEQGPGLTKVRGDGTTATVGTPADWLHVRLRGPDGQPAAGAPVSWAVTSGGGSLRVASGPATNENGFSEAQLTLGPVAGPQTVSATAGGSTVVFTVTGRPDVPARVVLVSGGGQAATAGTTLPEPVVVRAVDKHGNPTPGETLDWGPLGLPSSLSPSLTVTGADGTSSSRWTLAAQPGPNEGRASVRMPYAEHARFTATGDPVPVGPVASVEKTAGDGQTGEAGLQLRSGIQILARDAEGRPVEGASVTWTASSGGEVMTGTSTVTRADGRAVALWKLGPSSGPQTLTATVGGISATFTATGVPGYPHRLAAAAGDGQTGPVGTKLPEALVLLATDQFGNPVPGAEIRWYVQSGDGGTITPASGVTGADGTAAASWTLGSKAGAWMAGAHVGSGWPSVLFTATAQAASVATVTVSPASPTVQQGSPVQLAATPRDAAGNPLAGLAVAWTSSDTAIATVSGSGTVTGVAPGTATITATIEGQSTTATITVASPAP